MYQIVLSHLDIDDLKGIPYVKPETQTLSVMRGPLIPKENEEAVVFLDEITTVSQMKLAVALKIIDERRCGYFNFPQAYVVCAGNPPEWSGLQLDERIVSRCATYEIEPDIDSWTEYISGKYPDSIMAELLLAFLNTNKQYLIQKPNKVGEPFPTPRTYEAAIRMHRNLTDRTALLGGHHREQERLRVNLAACIGDAAAAQFQSFIKIYKNLPAIEKVLNSKEVVHFERVKDLNIGYALTCALAFGVKKQEQVSRVWPFVRDYISHLGMDFLVILAKILLKRGFSLGQFAYDINLMKLVV
jgi:hypothetical protein